MLIIPEKWRNEWSREQTRVLVLGSLSIQIGLIFLAPLRKRRTDKVLMLTLWLFYLMADYVATLALGNILSKQTDDPVTGIPGELTTLWAPFLLLHLGGPDPITSYSLEDNELWWRHLLGLVVQVITAGFVFLQSLPSAGLWIPTLFVFVPGLLKYGERTLALRAASMDNFKEKVISEHDLRRENVRVDFVSSLSNITGTESELILEGYNWFGVFKRLMVDVTFSSKTLIKSQDRFSEVSSKHALKVVAIELSFLHDILYTKAVIVHCISGRVVRCCSFISIVTALLVFHHLEKTKFKSTDIIVTYILLSAGLGLEVVAAVLLVISDWTVVSLHKSRRFKCLANAIVGIVQWILRNGKPRWSGTIGQYNLVAFCLREKDNSLIGRIMSIVKVKHMWNNMRATKMIPVPDLLEEMIFNEAKRRAQNVHIYKVLVEARSYRGRKALERHDQLQTLEWSMKKEFDECIILWHIATDICFHTDISARINDQNVNVDSERFVSWKTSNYMVYLLIQQPSMMQLGYGKTRFEATCAAIKKIFKAVYDEEGRSLEGQQMARQILIEKTEVDGVMEGDEKGMSLLFDSCRLAREMQKLNPKIKWQVISETWMEMLGYAAIHCGSYQHARALSRGGELITHLWLLMAQMGVVQEHKIQQFQSESV